MNTRSKKLNKTKMLIHLGLLSCSFLTLLNTISSAKSAEFTYVKKYTNDYQQPNGTIDNVGFVSIEKGTYTANGSGTILNVKTGPSPTDGTPVGQPGVLYVGDKSSGAGAVVSGLTISGGASVIVEKTVNVGASYAPGASSTLTVDNGFISANLFTIADVSNSTLSITNGGVVSQTNPSSGFYGSGGTADETGIKPTSTINIDGVGSTLSVAGILEVNYYGDTTVNVTNSGKITSKTATIGNHGGVGSVTLSGVGTSWSNAGRMSIATTKNDALPNTSGGGILNITNGAYVNTAGVSVGTGDDAGAIKVKGSGSLLTSTQTSSTDPTKVSVNVGAKGTLIISDSAIGILKTIVVAGGGSVTAESAANVTSDDVYIGNGDGTAILTATGSGTIWSTGPMYDTTVGTGSVNGGAAGNGLLRVLDGASYTTRILTVGNYSNTTSTGYSGEVVVDGAGTNFTTTQSTAIATGQSNTGKVTISNGAAASLSSVSIGTGVNANGSFYVQSGASVTLQSNQSTFIGSLLANSKGLLSIDGANTIYTGSSFNVYGASKDDATFSVTNGATANSTSSSFLYGAAVLNIDGSGSTFNVKGSSGLNHLYIDTGNTVTNDGPTVTISNSGVINVDYLDLTGTNTSARTAMTVTSGGVFNVGKDITNYYSYGSISLTISNGGTMSVGGNFLVNTSTTANGKSTIVVDGSSSSLSVAGMILSSGSGNSVLTLSNGGTITSTADILLTNTNTSSEATLNIGASSGDTAVASGIVRAAKIVIGSGTSTINFNHTSSNYTFSTQITEATEGSTNGTINQLSGRTRLTADSSSFGGVTNITGGSLVVNGILGGNVNITSNGILEGLGTVGTTVNNGTIKPGDDNIGTLIINGDYTSTSGTIIFETVLGDDRSETDFLHITGNSSGSTGVKVVNRGGLGALTTGNGIKFIQVDGTSEASNFSLKSDYSFEGRAAVIGGAYAYSLYAGNVAGTFSGDWYLRSLYVTPTTSEPTPVTPVAPVAPVYAATVPMYEVYPQILLQLNKLGTLEQRVGNRTWVGADKTSMLLNEPEGRGFWMKVEGSTGHINPVSSKTNTDYDLDLIKTQIGLDFLAKELPSGTLIGGVYFQYGHAKADISSRFGDGEIKTDGYGLGGTFTWYGQNGIYVDGVAQAMWYDSNIRSNWLANHNVTNDNHGSAYSLSLETGKKIAISQDWNMIPQVQLSYNAVDFNSFTDDYRGYISRKDGDALTGRIGVAFNHEKAWKSEQGDMRHLKAYGIGNIYYEFLNGTEVSVTHIDFRNRPNRSWGGVGGGLTYDWNNASYSIYGEVDARTSFTDFGKSYSFNGTIGFRAKF